jgi:hypothetical protein
VYTIRSATNQNHFIFASNDGVRAFGPDFDVRTHHHANEPRNHWIIEKTKPGAFVIRSETNPNHFLFYANDNSNGYNGDFDVRTHAAHEERNQWIIDNYETFHVHVKPALHPHLFLFVSNDHHRAFGGDFDIRTHQHHEPRNQLVFERVIGNVFTIKSHTN